MKTTYQECPLPKSSYGEAQYLSGRRLAEEQGVRLDDLVFDADETLWDWVMDFSRMLRGVPLGVLRRDMGHREYFRLKPGVLEMIWGLHHASLEMGVDPYLRIWTNGYAWRLWRISLEIPGFGDLLGPPANGAATPRDYREHPRVFFRQDYVDLALKLLDPRTRTALLSGLPEAGRRVIEHQLESNPGDSTLKAPELARLAGKTGFAGAMVLIDDEARNIERFVATGRRGVHLVCPTYSVLGGRIPNTVWRDPWKVLAGLSTQVAPKLVAAIGALAGGEPLAGGESPGDAPNQIRVASNEPVSGYGFHDFTIDVLGDRLRREWVLPRRRLKRAVRQRARP